MFFPLASDRPRPLKTAGRRHKIARRQVRVTLTVAVLVGVLFSTIQIYLDLQSVERDLKRSGAFLANAVRDAASEAAYRLDETLAERLVVSLVRDDQVRTARIVDDFGDIVARATSGEAKPVSGPARLLLSSERVETRTVLTHPGKAEGGVGALIIEINPQKAASGFSMRAYAIILSGVGKSVLLSLILLFIFHRTVTLRILRAAQRVDRAGRSDEAAAPVAAPDELDWLEDVAKRSIKRAHDQAERVRLAESALESAPYGVLIARADNDHETVYINRRFARISGYEPAEIIGRNCRVLNEGLPKQEAMRDLKEALAREVPITVVLNNVRKDGTPFWNRLSISPIRNIQGRVTHFVGIQEDVTEELEAQQTLQVLKDELTAVIGASPDGIVTLNAEAKITSFNHAAERLFDLEAREAEGQLLSDLLADPPETLPAIINAVLADDEADGSSATPQTVTVQGRRRDGGVFPARISLAPYQHRGARAAAASIQDLSVISQSNARLARMAEELTDRAQAAEQANEAKSAFLAHMSHELRTPLNAIIGFSEIILEFGHQTLKPGKLEDYVEDIHISGTHLLTLVNEVLDVARIEDETQGQLACASFKLDAVVEQAVGQVRTLAQRASIEIKVEAPADIQAWCEPSSLARGLVNLLSNAMKYSDTGRVVTLSVKAEAGRVILDVDDDGIGVADDVLKNLGAPFLRASDPYVRGIVGTGLGLTITKTLVERQGGHLTLERKPEGGTRARIDLAAG